jgi:hypothetical protein
MVSLRRSKAWDLPLSVSKTVEPISIQKVQVALRGLVDEQRLLPPRLLISPNVEDSAGA